jgi:hypothetical protein
MTNATQTALDLAERGISVFPCHQNKAPATKNGFYDATTDKAQIRKWFSNPAFLVGVPTGPENGLFLLDVDPAGMDWLVANTENLMCERMHKTKRGKHFIYCWVEGLKGPTSSAGLIGPGVDTRGEGGYMIWWPAHGNEFVGDLDDLTAPPALLLDQLNKSSALPLDNEHRENAVNFRTGERNSGLTSLAGRLRRAGLNEEQLLAQLQAFNRNYCFPPLPGNEVETIARSVGRYRPADPIKSESITPVPSLDWLKDFEMTEEELNEIRDPSWVIPDLVPEGHVVAIAAPPGAGKTTILFHLCKSLARTHNVIYVHADTNPSDAKDYYLQAKAAGIRYLTPDMKVGLSMSDVVENLKGLAASNADLRGHVWVFDTLKKMADVIQKKSLKGLLQIMRKLSARGMTIVLLSHTNKHKDADGKTVFEGTGDLKSDVDELIYLDPLKQPDGSIVVSTRPDKARAAIQPRTFQIDADRTVSSLDEYVDVPKQVVADFLREKDDLIINLVTEAIDSSKHKQMDIMSHCKKAAGIGEHRVRVVLKRYSSSGPSQLWEAEKQFRGNTWHYSMVAKPLECGAL